MFHTCTLGDISCLPVPTIIPCLPVSAHLRQESYFWLDNIWLQFLVCQLQLPWNPEGVSCLSSNHGSSLAWENSVNISGVQWFPTTLFWTKSKLKFRGSSSKFFLQWVTPPLSVFFFFFFLLFIIIVNFGYNPYVKLSLLKLLCVSCLIILLARWSTPLSVRFGRTFVCLGNFITTILVNVIHFGIQCWLLNMNHMSGIQ